jgi:actin-like ATPase involved in cell morphogenesis
MGAGRRRPVCGGVPYGSVQAKRRAMDGSLRRVGASVGEEPMKETAVAEINVGGRLRWVATATNDLGTRDPAVSN